MPSVGLIMLVLVQGGQDRSFKAHYQPFFWPYYTGFSVEERRLVFLDASSLLLTLLYALVLVQDGGEDASSLLLALLASLIILVLG